MLDLGAYAIVLSMNATHSAALAETLPAGSVSGFQTIAPAAGFAVLSQEQADRLVDEVMSVRSAEVWAHHAEFALAVLSNREGFDGSFPKPSSVTGFAALVEV